MQSPKHSPPAKTESSDKLLLENKDLRRRLDEALKANEELVRQALEMFEHTPERYGMIFMDIHMPEMDGYESTRAIRALNHPRAKTIPIVAMTANVFREDVEKCLEAGMNDHIGKSVDFGVMVGNCGNISPKTPKEARNDAQ